ncbi:MAG: hypothetical protein GX856_14410, partial [Gammaproteobacteria bacterium]|nr:hypothetical protein [Gammaproteobacteria bacterium]
ALIEYTRNRFAYSLALEVFRQALRRRGLPEADVSAFDRLSRFATAVAPHLPAPADLYDVLREIPEEIDWESLRTQYDLPDLRESYERYFGAVPEDERPRRLRLRGSLLFGLAESERARIFPDRLAKGDYGGAGRLMTLGHDGDRRVTADGKPFEFPVDDRALADHARAGRPLVECPGEYGASSPVLDALVDAALEAGALGACLTGAGIAGAVLALCRADGADAVARGLRARMARPDYARLAGLDRPLTPEEVEEAVVVNTAVDGAGLLVRP